VKLDKPGGFIGVRRARPPEAGGPQAPARRFKLTGKGIARHGYPVLKEGRRAGEVTSGTMSPVLKEPIGLAYVPAALAKEGSTFEVRSAARPWPARWRRRRSWRRSSHERRAAQPLLRHIRPGDLRATERGDFSQGFGALEKRTTVRKDTTYTGLYLYGEHTYLELLHRLGVLWRTFRNRLRRRDARGLVEVCQAMGASSLEEVSRGTSPGSSLAARSNCPGSPSG